MRLRPNLYMIAGAGGNIAVETGPDGTVLMDAGSAEASERVLATIQRLTDQRIRYIISTCADTDHVGGNGNLSKAGRSIFATGTEPLGCEFAKAMTNGYAAFVFAAENVLLRMSAPTGKAPPFPNDSWPTETFSERRRYLYLNHEGIEVFRQPGAHSDGDSIVFFRASDVIATGDVIDATRFPVIDVAKGGGIQGEVDALNRVIELAVRSIPFVAQQGIYLAEPLYMTRTFQLSSAQPVLSVGNPCIPANEGVPEGAVPHYLPRENPFMNDMMRMYNIMRMYNVPAEAALGGPETMYPDYRRKLKDRYAPPAQGKRDCGGPGGFPLRTN